MRKWLVGFLAIILVIVPLVHPLVITSQATLNEGFIDLYSSYPSCFGGQGWGRNASVIWPQKEFGFIAEVSYAGWPEQYKDVAFQLIDPRGETWGIWVNRTDEDGFTSIRVRMPWPCPTNETDPWDYFGIWKVIATVDIACKIYRDTMYFKYDYLVNIWNAEADKDCYKHGEDITVTIDYGTYSMYFHDVTFAITAVDSSGVPFGFAYDTVTIGKGKYGWCYYENGTLQLTVHVEKWARTGRGSLTVIALSGPLDSGGEPVFPETRVNFQIRPADEHDVAVVDLSTNKKIVTKGESATLSVTVRNEGSKTESFNVTLHSNSTALSLMHVEDLAPNTEAYLYFEWDTSSSAPGVHIINASIPPLVGETDIADNSDSETVHVEAPGTTPIHDLAVLDVNVSPRIVYAGGLIYISTTVKNKGSEVESFNVSVSYNSSTLIQRIFITSLPPKQRALLTFTWNTTDLVLGTYNLSVYAYPVPLETELSDNWLSAGIVTVLPKPAEIVHDVSVISAIAFPTTVDVGDVVTIRTVVRNVGTETETFDLSAFYEEVPILTQQVIQLYPLNERTLTFTWNTTDLALGTYNLSVYAYPVPLETELSDNWLSAGIVTVLPKPAEIVHDVSVISAIAFPTTVDVGDVVTIRTVVRNVGTETETFDLSAFYEEVPILTQQVIQLYPLNERTLTFLWNTTGLPLGTYNITIFAEPVPGEVRAEDNILTDSSVEIVSDFSLAALLLWVIQELYWLLALLLALIALLILLLLYRRRKRRPAKTKNQNPRRGRSPSVTSVKKTKPSQVRVGQAPSRSVKKTKPSQVRVGQAPSHNPRTRTRLSSKDFLKLAEGLWQNGPKVEYRNPNTWRTPKS